MSDVLEVRAPAEQSEGTRSQVLRWLKSVGETVKVNEPLVELETDKVTVEVAAPASGVLREILRHEQDEIQPGELLAFIEPTEKTQNAPAQTESKRASEIEPESDVEYVFTASPPVKAAGAVPLSPAVRRLLSEHGLEARQIHGTGEGGRITIDDVLAHVGGRSRPVATHTVEEPAEPVESEHAKVRRVPHTTMRKRVAEHMVQSLLHTAPHVTTVFEANMSAVLKHRAQHQEAFKQDGVPLTLTAYFVAAAVAAIRAVPEANSRWTDEALEIHEAINVGVATALGADGLVVPVIHDAQSLDLRGIARRLHELVSRAREGKLTPTDVRGGTFTISNHGVSGSLLAAPIIINQPQSAILGVGKLEKRAVVISDEEGDRVVIQPRCYVTLTIDHRVMDGYQANRFVQVFVEALERWPTE